MKERGRPRLKARSAAKGEGRNPVSYQKIIKHFRWKKQNFSFQAGRFLKDLVAGVGWDLCGRGCYSRPVSAARALKGGTLERDQAKIN
jgi:hypothetical protein